MSDFLNAEIAKLANPQQNQPTRGQRAKESADAIKQIAVQSVVQFVNNINQGFQLIWQNQMGLSPQEVCDALGTDARGVFERHAATAQFLVTQAPAIAALLATVPDGYTISYNEDGTVVISE
jgi:hypothetical protein